MWVRPSMIAFRRVGLSPPCSVKCPLSPVLASSPLRGMGIRMGSLPSTSIMRMDRTWRMDYVHRGGYRSPRLVLNVVGRRDMAREKLQHEVKLAEIGSAKLKFMCFIGSALLTAMAVVIILLGAIKVHGVWIILHKNDVGKSVAEGFWKSFWEKFVGEEFSKSLLKNFSSALEFVLTTMLGVFPAALIKHWTSKYKLQAAEEILEYKKLELTHYDKEKVIKA